MRRFDPDRYDYASAQLAARRRRIEAEDRKEEVRELRGLLLLGIGAALAPAAMRCYAHVVVWLAQVMGVID